MDRPESIEVMASFGSPLLEILLKYTEPSATVIDLYQWHLISKVPVTWAHSNAFMVTGVEIYRVMPDKGVRRVTVRGTLTP